MNRDVWLLSLCASRTLMTSVFMTYAATLPVLMSEWSMSGKQAGSISSGFHAGYAVSLVFFSWLADRVGARRVFLGTAWLSAVVAIAFGTLSQSYLSGLILYTLVGLSQGGTYTTAIMLFADRYPPERRGAKVGWLIGSSSAGYALSLVVCGAALAWGGVRAAFVTSAIGPVVGAALAWLALRTTPNVVHPTRPGARFGTAVLANARAMRLIAGYTFHSWELLGMWAWAPAFLTAALIASGTASVGAATSAAYVSAAFHVMGIVASTTMGRLSDHLGRRLVLFGLAAASAACSLVFGWLIGWPLALVFAVGAVYAFTALGDSPVLSTALTEAVSSPYLGSALAVRSLVGFGAGAVAAVVFGWVLDLTNAPGPYKTVWGYGFTALGVSGVMAAWCAFGLAHDRPVRAPAMSATADWRR